MINNKCSALLLVSIVLCCQVVLWFNKIGIVCTVSGQSLGMYLCICILQVGCDYQTLICDSEAVLDNTIKYLDWTAIITPASS